MLAVVGGRPIADRALRFRPRRIASSPPIGHRGLGDAARPVSSATSRRARVPALSCRPRPLPPLASGGLRAPLRRSLSAGSDAEPPAGLLDVKGRHRKPHTKVDAELSGSSVSLEVGAVALLADGACVAKQGGTTVLVTVCSDIASAGEADFMPLSVDYFEKAFAVGKIPSTWLRREGATSEKETLSARLVDRSIRPLFPEGYSCDTQVICTALSADGEFDPDVLALNAASAAIVTSDVPWDGPVAAVRVGRVDGKLVANPTHEQMESSDLNLVYAGTRHRCMMVEAGAKAVPEDAFVEALRFAHESIQPLLDAMDDLQQRVVCSPLYREAFTKHGSPKQTRGEAQWRAATLATQDLTTRFANASPAHIRAVVEALAEEVIRGLILDEGRRVDGRALDEVRPLTMEAGILPVVHGSALFARGETQVVCVTTLGSPEMAQTLEAFTGGPDEKRFMVHYSPPPAPPLPPFPPYATNGTGRVGGRAGRREVGHGALAERSILPVLPSDAAFPYAIRVNSEVTMSDGSVRPPPRPPPPCHGVGS
eukprot:tig00020603_g11822.t1